MPYSIQLGTVEGEPRYHTVLMICGCGRTVTVKGDPAEALYDLRDVAERAMSEHWLDAAQDAICRPWVLR